MNEALFIAGVVALALLAFAAGWLAATRWGRPPDAPGLIDHGAVRQFFSGYVDQISVAINGLQDDLGGLREQIDTVSTWAPGQEPTNPAQLGRFMKESSEDRARIHRAINRLTIAAVIAVAIIGPGVIFIVGRSVYLIGVGQGWWQ